MPEPSISRGALLSLLDDVFDVPEQGRKALTARVRLLGDLGVPRQRRAGMHVRAHYGFLEVVEVSIALTLMNSHMPPALAARYVREAWGGFVRFAVAGLLDKLPVELRDRYAAYDRGSFGLIRGNMLSTLGERELRDVVDSLPLAGLFLADETTLNRRMTDVSNIVINSKAFVPTIFDEFTRLTESEEDVRMMVSRLVRSAGDTLKLPH